jgi:rhodanese-related sulfurtransferase
MSIDYRSMWKALGLDPETHEALLGVQGSLHPRAFRPHTEAPRRETSPSSGLACAWLDPDARRSASQRRRGTSRAGRCRGISFLFVCALMPVLGSCRNDTKSADAPIAVTTAPSSHLDLKPILSQFLQDLPADGYQISARDVASAKPFIVDVRQPGEYAKGFIEGAVNIPLRELTTSLPALPSNDVQTVLVCDTGHRSAIGMAVLQMLGYRHARTLAGGLQAWREANLTVVTAPVPNRTRGQEPRIDPQMQAALGYYLVHTLALNWGAMDVPGLIWDQSLKSSAELEPMADVWDQGRSLPVDVDEPSEFAADQHTTAKLASSINLPLQRLPDVLDRIPMSETIGWACGVPNRFQPEPALIRFVVLSRHSHRATLGMMSMQLLGFHFVAALQGGLDGWLKAE